MHLINFKKNGLKTKSSTLITRKFINKTDSERVRNRKIAFLSRIKYPVYLGEIERYSYRKNPMMTADLANFIRGYDAKK
jgi:hypothetical protein